MQRAIVVFNPTAGRRQAERWASRAREHLAAAGLEVECLGTERAGHSVEIAREHAGVDLIVVAGGDGTLREAAQGLASVGEEDSGGEAEGTVLGFLPLGNANVIAREVGIPLDPERALRVLTEGTPRALDAARAGGRVFLAMVGVGYDASVTRWMDAARNAAGLRGWYRLHADSLYAALGLGALLDPFRTRVRMSVDGEPLTGRYRDAIVCNVRTYAKGWSVTPDALPDDGLLDVHARKHSWLPFGLWATLCAVRCKPAPAFIADHAKGRTVRIESDSPFHWQADGDPMGSVRSLDVEVLPSYLRLMTSPVYCVAPKPPSSGPGGT